MRLNKYKLDKYSEYLSSITRYCKCGHSVQFKTGIPYVICTYCGRLIFRDKRSEYNYKIKRRFQK